MFLKVLDGPSKFTSPRIGGCALEIELDRNGVQTRIVVSESVKKGSLGQKYNVLSPQTV